MELEPRWRGRFTFVQIAAPTRATIDDYRDYAARVKALAEEINARYPDLKYPPIVLLAEHHEPDAVYEYHRAADLCFVSSLHDGMNLVAKEFVAARDDEQGVLILSRFAGASSELPEALIVNPYNADQCAAALHLALTMPEADQREKMRFMRGVVREFNVYPVGRPDVARRRRDAPARAHARNRCGGEPWLTLPAHATEEAWHHAHAVRRTAPPRLGPDCALFLDIDGTLLELASTPDRVRVDAGIAALLPALAQRLAGAVALITGRTLEDADRLFPGFVAPDCRPARLGTTCRGWFDSPARCPLKRTALSASRVGPLRRPARGPVARGQRHDTGTALPPRTAPCLACASNAEGASCGLRRGEWIVSAAGQGCPGDKA